MPLDHGCRLHPHHGVEDLRPNPVKPHPEKSVCGEEPKATWVLPPQDTHLMSKGNELEFQGGAATKSCPRPYGNGAKISRLSRPIGVLSKHSVGDIHPLALRRMVEE